MQKSYKTTLAPPQPVVSNGGRWETAITKERISIAVLSLFVIFVAIVPLVYAINAAFLQETDLGLTDRYSLASLFDVYFGGEYIAYLETTLVLATIVTVASIAIGVLMAFLVARSDISFKGPLELLIIMPLFLSAFTGLIAWSGVRVGTQRLHQRPVGRPAEMALDQTIPAREHLDLRRRRLADGAFLSALFVYLWC